MDTRYTEPVSRTRKRPNSICGLGPHDFSDVEVKTHICRGALLIGCRFLDPRVRELVCPWPVAGGHGCTGTPHQHAVPGVQGLSFGFGCRSDQSTWEVEQANRNILRLVPHSPDQEGGGDLGSGMSRGSSYASVFSSWWGFCSGFDENPLTCGSWRE